MKVNLPVTGQEKTFPAGCTLVSRTDTKGIITFANDAFVEVSGFTQQELLGENHNIIRHPDVPPAIFEGMWTILKRGLPWHGVVKNRCKDGDHYWVDARVVPVKKDRKIIGYMSVRSCPTREAIAEAEQTYREAARNPDKFKATSAAGWRKHFSIKNGVTLGIVVFTLLMIAGGILGITGLNLSNSALQSLYSKGMEPVQAIGRINFLMADNRAQVALALHHNPLLQGAEQLDHGLESHVGVLERNRREIDDLWGNYSQGISDDAERVLSERYWQSRSRYVDEGLAPAKAALVQGDYAQAEALLLSRVAPLYEDANHNVTALLAHLTDRAKADFSAVAERNRIISVVAVAGISLGSLLMMLAGIAFFRATVVPLQRAVVALENIAEGNLTDNVNADAPGEPGRVMAAVLVMQMHLKVMINEIRQSAGSIRTQCQNLNRTMMNLAEHSEEQHDRIYQTLDASLEACGGLNALVANAEMLMQAVEGAPSGELAESQGLALEAAEALGLPASAPEGGEADACVSAEAGFLAEEVAGSARVQSFALEEVASQLRQVASLVVENREEVQGAWAASQQLEKTAVELDKLVNYFES